MTFPGLKRCEGRLGRIDGGSDVFVGVYRGHKSLLRRRRGLSTRRIEHQVEKLVKGFGIGANDLLVVNDFGLFGENPPNMVPAWLVVKARPRCQLPLAYRHTMLSCEQKVVVEPVSTNNFHGRQACAHSNWVSRQGAGLVNRS